MLDVKRMTLLRDLAETGTITAVADLHGVTSSAVSQQLRALETESGASLIHRSGRAVRLTATGIALVEECENVLAALERAEGAIRALDDHLSGDLQIGCAPSALREVASPLLVELTAHHRYLRPRIIEVEPENAIPLLKQGKLDVVVSYRYHLLCTPPPPGTTVVQLFHDPLVLAVPNELEQRVTDGGLMALRDHAWVSAPEPSSCREVLLQICRNAGFAPRIEHTCSDLRSALSLVSADLAVTILPELLTTDAPPGTTLVSLTDRGRSFEAVVRAGSEHQPAVAATLAALTSLTALRRREST